MGDYFWDPRKKLSPSKKFSLAKIIQSTFLVLLHNIWREKIAKLFWSILIFEVSGKIHF